MSDMNKRLFPGLCQATFDLYCLTLSLIDKTLIDCLVLSGVFSQVSLKHFLFFRSEYFQGRDAYTEKDVQNVTLHERSVNLLQV